MPGGIPGRQKHRKGTGRDLPMMGDGLIIFMIIELAGYPFRLRRTQDNIPFYKLAEIRQKQMFIPYFTAFGCEECL